ncbi:predicted protein [Naegleria gruberi]|uniref:Predicted protein n=1 Tax=Naegleria gruberi TaxID=5762 RepID=D2VFX1_NAEGR|nr:uncharacterized protein NAEGRDRAFT_67774 [Naegleria gruberi]EFC44263.1 predicted protein [Naegleria gruberi]|eukprot:XP_002677007.1 predicted protein [Naegleria gruberi strain NEG-M]
MRRIKCSICSPSSYLFNAEKGRVMLCDNFCFEVVKACQSEKALFNDGTPVFPEDEAPEYLCGSQTEYSIGDYVKSSISVLSSVLNRGSSESAANNGNVTIPTIKIDGSIYSLTTNCENDLYKLQHCFPGTSSSVDAAFITSILVYVWVIGVLVSSIISCCVFFSKWKRRSYQQIM